MLDSSERKLVIEIDGDVFNADVRHLVGRIASYFDEGEQPEISSRWQKKKQPDAGTARARAKVVLLHKAGRGASDIALYVEELRRDQYAQGQPQSWPFGVATSEARIRGLLAEARKLGELECDMVPGKGCQHRSRVES